MAKKTDWQEDGKDTIKCEKSEGAVLIIHHKSEPQGKGFIPIVTNCGSYAKVGNLFPAEWPDGLQKAVIAGRQIVKDYVEECKEAKKAIKA
jgi:hypothetical protein